MYGSMNNYGGYGMMFNNKRTYRRHEDSYTDYDEPDNSHFNESSSEFEEEEITEEEDEQLNLSDSDDFSGDDEQNDDDEEDEQQQEDSSSGNELQDIEQDEENIIDEILDMKIIPSNECWKHPASIMVRPEPNDVWRFDEQRPKTETQVPRSDAGYILERLKFLEEDVDAAAQEGVSDQVQSAEHEPLQTNQQKCYLFLIKWRGCANIHATWELESNL